MDQNQEADPLTFRNAPRVQRDGGTFIERDSERRLIEEIIQRDRKLLDRLAAE